MAVGDPLAPPGQVESGWGKILCSGGDCARYGYAGFNVIAATSLLSFPRKRESILIKEHRYFVYIMTSKRNGTLYVGVTSKLAGRANEHREDLREGFTKKYGVHMLVWFEQFGDIHDAILREKRIKKWRRAWKIELIEKMNPDWTDLFEQIK
ncbi:MAG TPA: GIY-YIG nuclease family protein [Rhizomicrobium sp.]|nr:GIY-YIG nuclease family protein [Rhizomicrobium sp.]